MLTLVGKDQTGIVAKISSAIFETGGNLGETSMIRLGGNFSVMMMVQGDDDITPLESAVASVAKELSLRMHFDQIDASLHDRYQPDVDITVYGADRAGIVAKVTSALANAGLHILDMQTVVAGESDNPIYIMQIEGEASKGVEALSLAIESIKASGVEVTISEVDTLIG